MIVAAAAAGAPASGDCQSAGSVPTQGAPLARSPREVLPVPVPDPRIVIHKKERELELYSGERLLRVYRIGLGLAPEGTKFREGDRRTPEGEYYVSSKNNRSQFYLFLGISYPNAHDAARGLQEKLISEPQYREILAASHRKKQPPQNTALGGNVGIHGNGSGSDWTWGCVALEDEHIRELFNAAGVGTPVTILP